MDKYFEGKPTIRDFIDRVHEQAKRDGYVETLQGHRRLLKHIWNRETEADALRQTVNTIIQGTGAYFTNYSVIFIHEYLKSSNKRAKLIATVHDSIVIDAPHEEVLEVAKVANWIMENLPIPFAQYNHKGEIIRYPIEADVDVGSNYKDVYPLDEELFKKFKSAKGYSKYHHDLQLFEDSLNQKYITEEQYEQGVAMIEANIENYYNIV